MSYIYYLLHGCVRVQINALEGFSKTDNHTSILLRDDEIYINEGRAACLQLLADAILYHI